MAIESPADLDYDLLLIEPRLADLDLANLSILNLGAGDGEGNFGTQINHLPVDSVSHVELHQPSLENLYGKWFAGNSISYHLDDALSYCKRQPNKSVDVALLIDVLEHFTREQALELLAELERIVRKRTLIWVPIGNCEQHSYGGNPYQEHQSTWLAEDFNGIGEVDVCWKHFHIDPPCEAAWVTIQHPNKILNRRQKHVVVAK